MRRISFETAKLAAEKGYDEDCDSVYDIHGNIIDIDNYGLGIIPEYCCPAPYQAELQEWLRNEHGVSVLVYLDETLSYIYGLLLVCILEPQSWNIIGLMRYGVDIMRIA